MKSPELQQLTASEPLTLEQEFDMQRSWREDDDSKEVDPHGVHAFVTVFSVFAKSNPLFRLSALCDFAKVLGLPVYDKHFVICVSIPSVGKNTSLLLPLFSLFHSVHLLDYANL